MTACAQCGLPAPHGAEFCCYGCELAHGIQAEARDDHVALHGVLGFTLVLAMIVMMLALFLYAEDVFDASADVELAWLRAAYRWASLVLTTPVMALAGLPLARRALAQLRRRRLSMDALIVLGAFAAYAVSIQAMIAKRHAIYFDSAATALVLATFGRWLEATARSKASRSLGPLLEVARGTVKRRLASGALVETPNAEIEPGMTIEVGAGEVVPTDLKLETDSAEIDLAVLTGESRPVVLACDATVPAGAVPVTSAISGIAIRASKDSALERLASLARSLGERRQGVLAWTDRFAAAITPVVAVMATLAFAYWTRTVSVEKGIIVGLAVVLAACPCSYAIASPLVHWLMLRRAFDRGVLVRGAEVLDALATLDTVAFDKTGTLTRSDPSVIEARIHGAIDRDEVMALVRALEDGNPHPIARALSRHAGEGIHAQLADRRMVAGKGVSARDEAGRMASIHAGAKGTIVLERDESLLASFVVDEQLRPEARAAVDALRDAGVRVLVLSGDDEARVARVAGALGIEGRGRLAPEEKVRLLGAGAAIPDAVSSTAMVGDGINDAPALAAFTSFTLGESSQLAKGIAQVTLLEPDLRLVPWTLALARRGVRQVKTLIYVSTAYNVVFVALACTGALRPVWAGLSMLISSLLAVAFAARIGSEPRTSEGDHGVDTWSPSGEASW